MSGWRLEVPSGRQLQEQPLGQIDDGLAATEERLAAARAAWPEGSADDFARISRRRWVDSEGIEYRVVPGQPLYSARGPQPEDVDVFVVERGRFRLMRRADRDEGTTVHVGVVGGRTAGLNERATGLELGS